MARYQVEELYGEEVVTSNDADAENALAAVEAVTGKVISPRALQSTGSELWTRSEVSTNSVWTKSSNLATLRSDELAAKEVRWQANDQQRPDFRSPTSTAYPRRRQRLFCAATDHPGRGGTTRQ